MDNIHFHFLSSNKYCAFGHQGCNKTALNIYETEDAIIIMAEISAADLEAMHIEVNPDLVLIRGERQIGMPAGVRRIHRMEIDAGPFEINVPLNMPIDPSRTTSRYHDGLLEIALPILKKPAQRISVSVREEQNV